ncbi:MAG: histidine--tRNA ligase [Bacteroidota bacterium]
MAQKPSIPKGTRDFGPAEVQKRKYILTTIETVFKKYGFMPIETPTMENLSTLTGKYGDEGDKLLFRVLNSGETWEQIQNPKSEIRNQGEFNKTVTEKGLRYDLTVPFARYVVMNRNEITFPFKRYQMQPVWRADRPQKGRYREFWQCDADVVGSDSLLNELDLIQIYDEAFRKLGIGKYELRMNNRKVLAGIAEVVKSVEVMSSIAVAIDKLDKIGEEGVRKELTEQGFTNDELNKLFDIITIKGENKAILNKLKSKLQTSTEGLKGIEELEFILNSLSSVDGPLSGVEAPINLKLDFSLARGLSYYTGCIFEVVSTEGTLTSSIGGGGRYDNLTGIFGLPNVSGVGISFGLDRIYDVIDELKLFPAGLNATLTKVLVCAFDEQTQQAGISIVKQLRDAGIASELYPDLPKSNKEKEKPMLKPMNYADALNVPYTIILRSDGTTILKNMKEKSENALSITDIIHHLTQ